MNLVTGATGHIGNVLVRELIASGEEVRVLILPKDDLTPLEGLDIELVLGDVLKPETLRKAMRGVKRVYHLAGMISILPGQYELLENINVNGTQNIVDAVQEMGVERLIYTSSIHALAAVPHGITIDETVPFDPQRSMGDYDRSKALATKVVQKAIADGLDAVIVCPTGVIGPFDYKGSEMGTLIRNTLVSKMAFYVDGAYDFVDVRDVASGEILAGKLGEKGETYILSGEKISILDMLNQVRITFGSMIPILRVPLPIANAAAKITPFFYKLTNMKPQFTPYSLHTIRSNSEISHTKATTTLGYHPRGISESIEDTIHWLVDTKRLAKFQI